ncbi:hypothetical protein HOD08_04345 [bacterium]|nr:hypothetical protein [bacterium]
MSNFLSRATALFAALAVFGMGSAGAVITATIAKATKINRLYVSESSSTDNKISIPAGAVIVDGDAAFHAPAGYFLEVEVGASGPVAFIPTYPGMSGATYDVGHLAFWAGLGGEILVDVQDDLFLSGYNNSSTNVTVSQDLCITFSGQGKINFKIGNGKMVSFDSRYDSSGSDDATMVEIITSGTSGGAGARAHIIMDQTKFEAEDAGVNKLVFSRRAYTGLDSGLDGTHLTTTVEIGRNSYLTFVSSHQTGVDPSYTTTAYAAMAFDVSCSGSGRLLLYLKGGDVADKYRDGAFNICGHWIGNQAEATETTHRGNTNDMEHIRKYIQWRQPAGALAIVRVTDELAYAATPTIGSFDYKWTLTDAVAAWKAGTDAVRSDGIPRYTFNDDPSTRGLLIINTCTSIPSFASNTYTGTDWYGAGSNTKGNIYGNGSGDGSAGLGYNPVQPGMVLGVNGMFEVYHNTFLHHVSGNVAKAINPSTMRMTGLAAQIAASGDGITTVTKKHNPSAFFVDGLADYSTTGADPILLKTHKADSATPNAGVTGNSRTAMIKLLGNAKAFFCCGANSSGTLDLVCRKISTTEFYDLKIGQGTYDYNTAAPSSGETTGEGECVLDVEGPLTIKSLFDDYDASTVFDTSNWPYTATTGVLPTSTPTFSRHAGINFGEFTPIYTSGVLSGWDSKVGGYGELRLPTVRVDYHGIEVDSSHDYTVKRPFSLSATLDCYNRPNMLINADTTFQHITYRHNEMSTNVTAAPTTAIPTIVGGELPTYNASVIATGSTDLPVLWLDESNILCHESLAVSGIRLAIAESLVYTGTTASSFGSNAPEIVLYNHGDAEDTTKRGYGRVFMLGSSMNKLADGETSTYMQNAYINTFRQNAEPHNVGLFFDDHYEPGMTTSNRHLYEKATHIIHLGNSSSMSAGWYASNMGITTNGSDVVQYPWDGTELAEDTSAWSIFTLDSTSATATCRPAQLGVVGGPFHFSASDSSGDSSPSPVTAATNGRTIFVNYGGKFRVGNLSDQATVTVEGTETTTNPDRMFYDETDNTYIDETPHISMDTTIAVRMGTSADVPVGDPVGTLSLPSHQVAFSKPVQAYYFNPSSATANVDLTTFLKTSNEYTIPWQSFTKPSSFLPVKSMRGFINETKNFDPFMSKTLKIETDTVAIPTGKGYLQAGSGVRIDQMVVTGSTPANPLHLYLTGDTTDFARVREFVTTASATAIPGEGAYAALFIDKDAHVGLGSRSWNADSVRAWNKIGKNHITLYPNGNGVVELNSDILVADPQPIIPTTAFGDGSTHRLTFYSEDTHEIRVPRGGELDLSAFGSLATLGNTQQLTIAGRVKLIFEAGSTLRFPYASNPDAGEDAWVTADRAAAAPVLYMNDNSELIFEESEERLTTRTSARDLCGTDNVAVGRSRIMGVGQIWLNKNARMRVMDKSIVGVEADARTPETNLTISVQKEAAMLIGDPNTSGGVFQVGNVADGTSQSIYFTLRVYGPRAQVHVDREGVFGLGAGVKLHEEEFDDCRIRALYDVAQIDLRVVQGSFSNNQIYLGSDSKSSAMLIGPATKYVIDLGNSNEAIWRGGGNLIYVTSATPFQPSVVSTATALVDEWTRDSSGYATAVNSTNVTANNNKYTIMGSGIITRQLALTDLTLPYTVSGGETDTNIRTILSTDDGYESSLANGKRFYGKQKDVFNYLGFTPFTSQSPSKFVTLGHTQFEYRIGYVNGTTITRTANIPLFSDKTPEGAAKIGALLSATVDADGGPASYTLPEPPRAPNVSFVAE